MDTQMLEDVLKAARNKLNLKQSEVAEMVGITTQTYLKWENGRSEPKISQAGKLAKVLNLTEKELCQGELQTEKVDALKFVRRVGVLMSQVPQTELLIGMHRYINDAEGFIEMLAKISDHPLGLLEAEEREDELLTAKLALKMIAEQGYDASSNKEEMERIKEHALKIIDKG